MSCNVRNANNKPSVIIRFIRLGLLSIGCLGGVAFGNEDDSTVRFYNESHYGDLGNVANHNTQNGNLGVLKKGTQYIVQGTLATDDYRDSIYFETDAPFTVSIIGFKGPSSTLVTFGFGPEFPVFPNGVEQVTQAKPLYQGKKLQSGNYRFDFGAPGGPGPNEAIDHYAVHIDVDTGLEALPISSLPVKVGGGAYFLRADRSAFMLENREWLDIEYFLSEAKSLPVSESAMRATLPINANVGFSSHFVSLKEKYIAIRNSALYWQNSIYPNISVASNRLSESSELHSDYIMPIDIKMKALNQLIQDDLVIFDPAQKLISEDNISISISTLIEIVKTFETAVQSLSATTQATKTDTLVFSTVMKNHKNQIGRSGINFDQLIAKDNTAQLQSNIDAKNSQINSKSRQISDKERQLALSAIGGAISVAIASAILVPQINGLKSDRQSLINQRNRYQSQLHHATLLYAAYRNAKNSISKIQQTMLDTAPYFEQLKLQWQNLDLELKKVVDLLVHVRGEQGLKNDTPIIGYGIAEILIKEINRTLLQVREKNQSYVDYAF